MKEKATIYDYARLCRTVKNCENCPLCAKTSGTNLSCDYLLIKYPDKANEIIINWRKEHPIKTRQSEFLKIFPNAKIGIDGVIEIAPCTMEKGRYDMTTYSCIMSYKYTTCAQCRKEYWLAEVDENE